MTKKVNKLKVKIFADGADLKSIYDLSNKKYIKGITTNPTLMRKSGVKNYILFAQQVLKKVKKKSISLEVFADNPSEIEYQATKISELAENVFVKIPIMNTRKKYLYKTIKKLSDKGIKLNITAIMTFKQVKDLVKYINPNVETYISIFAGRIADTGRDPIPIMKSSVRLVKKTKSKILWASTREIYNIFQANDSGCHIITVGYEFIKKLNLIGYNLENYSLDTVRTFFTDAKKSGYKIK